MLITNIINLILYPMMNFRGCTNPIAPNYNTNITLYYNITNNIKERQKMNKKYISDLTIKEYKLYNTLAKLRSEGKITQEQFDYKLKQILTKGE